MARTYGAPNANNNNSGARANNNSNAKLIGVSIAVIAILAVLGVGGYFILGNKSDGNEQPSADIVETVPGIDTTESIVTAEMIWSDITPNAFRTDSPNPEYTWIFVDAHYERIDNPSDKISTEAYQSKVDYYNNNYAGTTPGTKPVDPKESGLYRVVDGNRDVWVDNNDVIVDMESLENNYLVLLREYENSLNPEDVYQFVDAKYCNRNNIEQAITTNEYDILLAKYDENNTSGLYTAYELSIPAKPYDPEKWYIEEPLYSEEDEESSIDIENEEEIGPVANSYCINGIETAGTDATRGKYHMHIIRGITRSSDGWFDYNDNNIDSATVEAYIASLEGTPITDGNEGGEGDDVTSPGVGETYEVNKNFQYRHKLDGHVISYDEYRELCNKYRQDVEAYNSEYQANFDMYH